MFSRSTNVDKAAAKAAAKAVALSQRRGMIPSVIATGMHVLGNIVSDGVLDIEGKIEGNVRGQTITIRPDGIIRGDVVADMLHVYGAVEGLIKARSVHLYAQARVSGTIMHESITIEDGALVDGKFKRTDKTPIERSRQMEEAAEEIPSEDPAPVNLLQNLRLITNKE